MATHYIENASSGNQYYFNTNDATTSHSYQSYSSPVRSTYSSSTYSTHPVNVLGPSNQPIHFHDSYQTPQNYQSVAGFNKSTIQQHHHAPLSPPPQSRTTVRAVSSQDRNNVQRSPQVVQTVPQQLHVQYDNRQRPGHPTGPPVVYQTPGAAQYTHHNVDLWSEGSPQNNDYYVQAQRVSVRSVSTGSPQQSHSVSQRYPDHLQQYYSQLTPEQHQQLLRQQKIQRQHEQNAHHEQQHRVTAQQVSPSSIHHQQQYHSTARFDGGQQNQQRRVRSDSEKQLQDEQEYYAAQRRLAAQRTQQQQQQQQQQQNDPSHPVGIRNLMNKFAPSSSVQTVHSRSKVTTTTTTRHYSGSGYPTQSSPRQAPVPTNRALTSYSMTYSALPKPVEPPVNSIEYYQMQMQQGGSPFTNIQQAVAPPHIQHGTPSLGALRDNFKTVSVSDDTVKAPVMRRPEQTVQQHMQQPVANARGGNTLSLLRDQYINQAKQLDQYEPHAHQVPAISRTILGEDVPQPILQQPVMASQGASHPPFEEQLQPSPQVLLKQAPSKTEAPKPEPTPTTEPPPQEIAPAAQAPQPQSVPATETPQSTPTTEAPQSQSVPETPQQQPAEIEKASEKQEPQEQSQSAATKEAPKKETTSTSQAAKKEPGSTSQTTKKESTPSTQASKDKVASTNETKKEKPQKNQESTDQTASSSETATTPTANGETA